MACLSRQPIMNGAQFCKYLSTSLPLLPVVRIARKISTPTINVIHGNHKGTATGCCWKKWKSRDFLGHSVPLCVCSFFIHRSVNGQSVSLCTLEVTTKTCPLPFLAPFSKRDKFSHSACILSLRKNERL